MGVMVSLSSSRISAPRPAPSQSTASDPATALWRRGQESGLSPLLTWYCDGDRVELSGRTVMTWVVKTVHLLDDEGIEAGDAARLTVVSRRPGHWMSCVWLLSCWWAGLRADTIDPGPSGPARDVLGHGGPALEVVGPDGATTTDADLVVQTGLAALGGPCPNLLPGAVDHHDALVTPDEIVPPRPARADAVWLRGHRDWTGADLAQAVALDGPVLLGPSRIAAGGAELVAATLTGCLAGGGSLVLVESGDAARIAAQERAVEV